MQVSWIDADRIKALVEQIAPPEAGVEEPAGVVEIHTTPEALMGDETASWGFAMDWGAPTFEPAPATAVEMTAEFPAESEPLELEPETEAEDEYAGPEQPLHNPAAALPLSRIRDKLRAIRQRATEAGILTRVSEAVSVEPEPEMKPAATPPADEGGENADAGMGMAATEMAVLLPATLPQTPAFDLPPGSREERLSAFAGWAKQVLHEEGGHVLVMSDDGEVLWGGEAKAGLVLSTMMAWGAAIRASAMSACETPPVIHQPLASGNVLTVIPCETAGGMVHAAVAAPAGLSHEQAGMLRGALCAAMN